MKEEMMTTGFTGSDSATGPTAGYDPVMKFRGKLKKKDAKKLVAPGNKLGESKENPTMPSRLFQYKVDIPEVGETVIFANSPAELRQKLRLLINPRYRGNISIERIFPGEAGKFFMDKRQKALRNVNENEQAMKNQMAQQKISMEKKQIQLKQKELAKQLSMKTAQIKKQARAGAEQDATR